MRISLPLYATLTLTLGGLAQAQFNGSIYTTDQKADVENIFKSKKAVYFAGGPGPNAGCSGNGLPDGVYVYQVTNPSGSILLSSDGIEDREVIVSGGVIVDSVDHGTKPGPCGSRIVKVDPFDTTPSNGDEYKLWLTPLADYMPGEGHYGFRSADSKTDSFKVRGGQPVEQTILGGTVFYDINETGIFELGVPLEVPIAGWKVTIDSGGEISETFTDSDGRYEFIRDLDFSTHVLANVAPAPGFIGIVGGRFLATSQNPVVVVADVPEVTVDFGILRFTNTPSFARSKGYWHNQGETELAACDPLWRNVLNSLSLRTNFTNPNSQAGTLFTVSTSANFEDAFQELSGYLTGNPSLGVIAFILSTQYAAANLNKTCGPLQATTFIDRLADDVLVAFGDMAADTLALLANPRSAYTGPGEDEEWRQVLMGCLDEWNCMNSSGDNIFTPQDDAGNFVTPF